MKSINKPIMNDNLYGIQSKEYLDISKDYKSLSLKSLAYIFSINNSKIGYMC